MILPTGKDAFASLPVLCELCKRKEDQKEYSERYPSKGKGKSRGGEGKKIRSNGSYRDLN